MVKFCVWAILSVMHSCLASVSGRSGFGPGEQDWGFIDVRDGGHLFYWLYYTTANVANYTERPLVIWLQGGPGTSSAGFGNFEELGPLDLQGNHRSTTWVKDMNVLFIDSPVGSGFSYVDNVAYFTATNTEVAFDLLNFLKEFYRRHPEFERVPLHIFGQSYGGKMAAEFALELYYSVRRRELKSNLTSVVLGAPWISPIDAVMGWGPHLLEMGIIDSKGYHDIMAAANLTSELIGDDHWIQATYQWVYTQWEVLKATKGVDFYNVLTKTRDDRLSHIPKIGQDDLLNRSLNQKDIDEDRAKKLEDLMRGAVAKTLGIPAKVVWGSQSADTFELHRTDFMKPAISVVNELLDKTTVQVGVFMGILDLITTTSATASWIDKLQWSKRNDYVNAPRYGISVNRMLEGYQKSGGNFTTFWINRAGHSVPADNPEGFTSVLQHFTQFGKA